MWGSFILILKPRTDPGRIRCQSSNGGYCDSEQAHGDKGADKPESSLLQILCSVCAGGTGSVSREAFVGQAKYRVQPGVAA